MKKVFTKIAGLSVGLALAIGVGVAVGGREAKEVKAADVVEYTLDGYTAGTGTNYATDNATTQGGVEWIVNGNISMTPWRIGGNKSNGLSSADTVRYVQSQAAVSSENISKVVVMSQKPSKNSINPTDVSLKVGTAAGGSQTSSLSNGSWGTSVTFNRPNDADWASKYFEIDFTMPENNTTTNKFIELTSVTFYYESSATLQSISLAKGEGAKTSYVDGDTVSFDDIKAIGHYSDGSDNDVSSYCTITADRAKVATGETKITYSATYTPGGFTIADLDVSITVVDLAIDKVEKNGNYRLDFVQKQKFSYGTGKVKVTWNNGSTQTLDPTAEGVTAKIGTTDITGQTHYMTLDDNGKDLVMSYGGENISIGTITVTPYVEPESGYWSPITDLNDLTDGLEVIIVASNAEFAMGKYTTGNNVTAIDVSKDGEGKISSSIPGVQVYTLVESDVVANSFGLFDGTAYLSATGTGSNNYLKTEESITESSSFKVSIDESGMKIVGQKASTNSTMRYNPGSIIFSCYSSTSGVGSLACLYKFTPESKSEDQIAVENFCKTSLHLDDSDPSYIDPNDNTSGTACKGETGYYALAKEAYNGLTEAQVEIFATSADVLIAQGRARLAAWAEANGETFDAVSGTFSSYISSFALSSEDNNTMIIVVVIAAVSALAFTTLLVFKKKKQK